MSKEIEAKLDALMATKREADQKRVEAAARQTAIDIANYNEFLNTIESQVLPAMKDFSQLLKQRDIISELDETRLRGECPEINYNRIKFEVRPPNNSMIHDSAELVIQRNPKNNSFTLERSMFKSQLGGGEKTSRPVSLAELTSDFVSNELLALIEGMP
jgi:hypothetical protein